MTCLFCGGANEPIYRMSGLWIVQCRNCSTATVEQPPSNEAIRKYYDGFLFQACRENISLFVRDEIRDWLQAFRFPKEARMLDVGGGGGFMAHAFREFGFGEPFYVDLDEKACAFASNELKISNVFNGDVCSFDALKAYRFDFIYSRHVIEHVVNPVDMIDRMIGLLRPGGVIEMTLPNGASLEYFGHPALLKSRIRTIRQANPGWSTQKVLMLFLSGYIAHGIDPIRHLWAITPAGLRANLSGRDDVTFDVRTAPLDDPVYSMYFSNKCAKSGKTRVRTRLVAETLGRMRGQCHLIARIRRKIEVDEGKRDSLSEKAGN